MTIEPITNLPSVTRGRPIIYPFKNIEPGQKLIIPGEIDLQKQRNKVVNALNNFKKSNDFTWATLVVIEENNITVYRIS